MSRNWRGKGKGQQAGEISFYWQHYGLSQDPFAVTPNEVMYYSSPRWDHYIDLLQHLIKTKNVLLAVTGGEGCGKTTLAQHFIQQINETMYLHFFTADSLFSTRKLVRELEHGFNLKAPVNEAPEDQLDIQITAVQYSDKTCLLVIDDAHFLPLETLNSLLFLLKQQSSYQMRLHILLFGDRNLQTKLANLAKNELIGNFVHDIELTALNLAETKEYLQYRMQKAGLVGALPFSQMQIEQLYAQSEGMPVMINRLAQQILLNELSKKPVLKKPSLIYKHQTKIIGGLLVVSTLICASYVLNQEGQYSVAPQKPVIAYAGSDEKVDLPSATTLQTSQEQPEQPLVKDQLTSIPSIPQQIQTVSADVIPVLAPKQSSVAVKSHKLIRLANLENVDVTTQEDAKQFGVSKQQQVAMQNVQPPADNDKITDVPVVKAKKIQHHAINKHKPIHHGRGYTIQLIGLSHKAAVERFINRYSLQKQATYYQSHLRGKPFYILIYGEFSDRHQANAAIKALPAALQRFNPYVRTYASVHKDMK